MSADEPKQTPAPGPDGKPEPAKFFADPPIPPEETGEADSVDDEDKFWPDIPQEEEDLIAFLIIMGEL